MQSKQRPNRGGVRERLSPEPLHFRIGYDPTRRFAYSGAALAF